LMQRRLTVTWLEIGSWTLIGLAVVFAWLALFVWMCRDATRYDQPPTQGGPHVEANQAHPR